MAEPVVLVADDEEAIRSAMIRTVEGLGLSVEAVEDGNIAFVYAKQGITIELIDTDKRAKRIK